MDKMQKLLGEIRKNNDTYKEAEYESELQKFMMAIYYTFPRYKIESLKLVYFDALERNNPKSYDRKKKGIISYFYNIFAKEIIDRKDKIIDTMTDLKSKEIDNFSQSILDDYIYF